MSSPLPDKCDGCSRQLVQPMVVCSRCKGFAYCDEACRKFDWSFQHNQACSVLPDGELVPAKIEYSQRVEAEIGRLGMILDGLITPEDGGAFLEWKRTGVDPPNPDPGPKTFTYAMPPSLAAPPIAGFPPDGDPASPQLRVRQLARFLFLYDIARLPHSQLAAFFSPASLPQRASVDAWSGGAARLYGPKVLHMPDRLSMDEYGAVMFQMFCMLMTVDLVATKRWMGLMGWAMGAFGWTRADGSGVAAVE